MVLEDRMTEVGDQPATPPRTWRPMVLWSVAILLTLTLAWFVGTVATTFLQVRSAARSWSSSDVDESGPAERYVERLGGPERAEAKLTFFVGLPRWAVGIQDRTAAADLLGSIVPWERACALYRATPHHEVKVGLLTRVFGEFPAPIKTNRPSKADIMNLLGKPDAVWGDGAEFIYTGEGYVSDGMSGYILAFDAEGRLASITGAN
jgi:hypothetical protein